MSLYERESWNLRERESVCDRERGRERKKKERGERKGEEREREEREREEFANLGGRIIECDGCISS